MYPAYNLRNNEISAVIGINQLKRLDKNNKVRIGNFNFFLKHINRDIYETDFDVKGSCNYAFPLILKRKDFKTRDILETKMI